MRPSFFLAALLLYARVAAADPTEEARLYSRAGKQAYAAVQYLAAARAYERAYELAPLPAITFSAAQAYRRQYVVDGRHEWLERARSLYRRYLVEQPSGGRREHAVIHLSSIEAILTTLEMQQRLPEPPAPAPTQILVTSQVDGAQATVDGKHPGRVPLLADVEPGKHVVAVRAPGHRPARIESQAVGGQLVVTQLDPVPLPAQIRIEAPQGTEIWLDGRLIGSAPISGRVPVPAGRHVLRFQARGRVTRIHRFALRNGEHWYVRVALAMTGQRLSSYWLMGGALAAGAAAGVVGIFAVDAEADARSLLDRRDERDWRPDELRAYRDATERREVLRYTSVGLGVGALGLGISGALLHVLDDPANPPNPGAPRLRAALAAGGASLHASASW